MLTYKQLVLILMLARATIAQVEGNEMTGPDIDAVHYRAHSSVQYGLAENIFSLHEFRGDEHVLDIGCGDGKLTTKLATMVPNGFVDGRDPSKTMIALAQTTFPAEEFRNVSFEIGAAEDFSLDKNYDLVTAFSCLHWVRDQESAIKRMVKTLKDKGRLLILTFPRESPYLRVLQKVIYSEKWLQYAPQSACEHWITSEGYQDIVKQLPLNVLYMHTSRAKADYQDTAHFKDYVKGWLPCLLPLPMELQEDFLDDLGVCAHSLYGSDTEVGFTIPYDKIIMYLEKR